MTPLPLTAADNRRVQQFRVHGTCRHCQSNPAVRPRKLCGRCWRDLAIRNQYESKRPAAMIAKMCLSLAKRMEFGDKMAATKELNRFKAAPIGSLPCGYCSAVVAVAAWHYVQVRRIGFTWTQCSECKAKVSKIIAHPGEDNE